ncbi:hypothetical protein VSU19_11935 [Verrucomicrobiales bacterium BCK34]|nr:hypothetical protein [Verrucomicrobiales bacterium BCK34]
MVSRSRFSVPRSSFLLVALLGSLTHSVVTGEGPGTENEERGAEIFRPAAGEFPPLEKAHAYRGELTLVDHVNRRGSIRVQTEGKFRFIGPSPFAMLPYGMVNYHGAPANLRDVPLGTMLHVRAFLPPDPKISSVPVLPVDNRTRKSGNAGTGSAPAENHVLLLEDEASFCLREGKVWKLMELEISNHEGMIVARRESKAGGGEEASAEEMTFDAATRVWRGREFLGIEDLISEGVWPASGKKSLDDQPVLLGITWKPTPGGVFNRFHISDIWLDDAAMERATRNQTETHRAFIRSRWMPAWIDAVEYGKFGDAKVTVTLFGGMDESLYADFKKGSQALLAASENTLKHWAGGTAGTAQMASKGPILDLTKRDGDVPAGSSGIQIQFQADLITEGIRPGRVVILRPASWPDLQVPRDEYLLDHKAGHEDRFPTPAFFPTY